MNYSDIPRMGIVLYGDDIAVIVRIIGITNAVTIEVDDVYIICNNGCYEINTNYYLLLTDIVYDLNSQDYLAEAQEIAPHLFL